MDGARGAAARLARGCDPGPVYERQPNGLPLPASSGLPMRTGGPATGYRGLINAELAPDRILVPPMAIVNAGATGADVTLEMPEGGCVLSVMAIPIPGAAVVTTNDLFVRAMLALQLAIFVGDEQGSFISQGNTATPTFVSFGALCGFQSAKPKKIYREVARQERWTIRVRNVDNALNLTPLLSFDFLSDRVASGAR